MNKNYQEEKLNEMRRQAYFDSANSAISNANRHKNNVDPILQKNEYFVSTQNFIFQII